MFGGEESDKYVKVLSGGERSRLAMIRLLLEPVNLLILDEPTNHLDMASKDVLKEAIRAFDGTAIIVSHDREFLDGLVTKVYEFGGGKVREYLGGIYDWIEKEQGARSKEQENSLSNSRNEERLRVGEQSSGMGGTRKGNTSGSDISRSSLLVTPSSNKQSYAEHKEQQKRRNKAEKAVKESEQKIEKMEARLKELDALLCDPQNASDMTLVTEYTTTKQALDEEVERWEELSETLEQLTN
jgi:ATP-binding cassette subfamily F protein 3